jgi:hypothetical protein
MKHLALTFLLTGLSLQSLLAWGGPGPWANGAYYPGQLDGRYSANVYNNTQDRGDYSEMYTPSESVSSVSTSYTTNANGAITGTNYTTNNFRTSAAGVVSGVVGFGISGGSPSVSSNGGTATVGSGASINADSSENYFVIYVDGVAYAGQTVAGINLHTQRVAGSLVNGSGSSYNLLLPTITTASTGGVLVSTTNFVSTSVQASAASGYFNAKIKSDQSPFIFKGAGEISTIETLFNFSGNTATYPFNLDGIKVSDN